MNSASRVSFLLQQFFTQRLMNQRNVSSHTIACYRDTFRLLLEFIHRQKHRVPSQPSWEDFDAPLIGAFLDHCERDCHNVARTRNLRLTAIRSFFRYVSFQEPAEASRIQQILVIPNKRQPRRADRVPDLSRGGSFARCPGSVHLERTPGPHFPPARCSNRASPFGGDRIAPARCHPRYLRSRLLPGQRPQGTSHSTCETHG
jgi:hypothetical protein